MKESNKKLKQPHLWIPYQIMQLFEIIISYVSNLICFTSKVHNPIKTYSVMLHVNIFLRHMCVRIEHLWAQRAKIAETVHKPPLGGQCHQFWIKWVYCIHMDPLESLRHQKVIIHWWKYSNSYIMLKETRCIFAPILAFQ